MEILSAKVLAQINVNLDEREQTIRGVVYDALSREPAPDVSEAIVASYFVCANTRTVSQVGGDLCYHMTSGVHHPQPGSLLDECTGKVVGCAVFDGSGRCGLVRVAFPLKMLLDERGNLYSTSILHIVGGAGAFALTEHADIKLVHVAMSQDVLGKFPGPAHGAPGVRRITKFGGDEVAFGTILKPCTGITPAEEAELVSETAANPLFLFIKEDENFLPGVAFAPLSDRLRAAREAIERVSPRRGGKGLIFAPHVGSPPHLLGDNVKRVVEAGCNGIMLSEYYAGGAIRVVREMTKHLPNPPAIYGHNGGITTRTRHIYREVLDLLARLDGIDFRQTAPLTTQGPALLRPSGLEWRKCEEVLSQPLAGHAPVMIARAGGLDQGNILPNLADETAGAGVGNYLFLAGSAINGIKNEQGRYDPAIGAEAMRQALDVFREGPQADVGSMQPADLKSHADTRGLNALSAALVQRYSL